MSFHSHRKFSLSLIASFVLGSAGLAQNPPHAASVKAPDASPGASSQQPDRSSAYYHYMLAHQYEEMATTYGRPEYATRAIEEYKLALNEDPTSKYLNSHLAELYFRTGRISDAVLAAQEQIKKHPEDLEAHKLLAGIYIQSLGESQQGQAPAEMLQLAIGEYSKIVQLEPANVEDHLMLGRLYAASHDSVNAEAQFQDARKIDPDSEDTALTISHFYGEEGDTKRAIQVLSAVPAEDQTPRTEYELGTDYDQLKDAKNAIASYRKALDLEPDNLDVERALAKALLSDGQYPEALQAYKDIASGDPSDPEAYLRISDIERHQGDFENALTTLKKAKSLVSDSLEIDYNEALLDDAVGHYEEAEQTLQQLVAKSEHTSGQYSDSEKNNRFLFLDRLATVYQEDNKTDAAIDIYNKMAELGGEYAEHAYESEVEAYRDAHEYDKATEAARTGVAKLPRNTAIKLTLAGQLADTGHAEEAISMAKSMLNGSAGDREVYLELAQIDTRLRRWKDASEDLDQADKLSTKPEDKWYAYFLRGALEERQKHYDQAETDFRKVLDLDPNNSATLNYFGYMLADRGVQLNEALDMIQKAVRLDPMNYAYLDSLGWAYFKLGQYKQAEDDLRRASERNATDPTVHDHLGELYDKTGRLKLAAEQWAESLNEYAHSLPADSDPGEVSKVQKKLDSARVRLARESAPEQPGKL